MTQLNNPSSNGLTEIIAKTFVGAALSTFTIDLAAFALKEIQLQLYLRCGNAIQGASSAISINYSKAGSMTPTGTVSNLTGLSPLTRTDTQLSNQTTQQLAQIYGTGSVANLLTPYIINIHDAQNTVIRGFDGYWIAHQGGAGNANSGQFEGLDTGVTPCDGFVISVGVSQFSTLSWYKVLGMK